MTGGGRTAMIWCGAGLFWLVAVCASLASARNYGGLVTVALSSTAAYGGCANVLRRRTSQVARALLVLLTAPIVVLTVDNVGRAVHMMGGLLFRVLL
jgi:hypothetical protein